MWGFIPLTRVLIPTRELLECSLTLSVGGQKATQENPQYDANPHPLRVCTLPSQIPECESKGHGDGASKEDETQQPLGEGGCISNGTECQGSLLQQQLPIQFTRNLTKSFDGHRTYFGDGFGMQTTARDNSNAAKPIT